MQRLSQYLNEMKLINGEHGRYWQVRTWTEVVAVFSKIPLPDYSARDENGLMLLKDLGIDNNFKVLRAVIHQGKSYVWDGYHGGLHDTGCEDLGLADTDLPHEDDDNLYLSYDGHLLVVESAYSGISVKSNKTLKKLIAGARRVHYKDIDITR